MAAADPPRNTGLRQVFAGEGTRQNQETESNKIKAKIRQINVKYDYIVCFNTIYFKYLKYLCLAVLHVMTFMN